MEKLNELLREYAQAIRRDDGTGFMHADAIRELFRARAASANETGADGAKTEAEIRKTMTPEQIRLERNLTCEAIDGAMSFGYQNTNPPPSADHWLAPFWKIGRKQYAAEFALRYLDDQLTEYLEGMPADETSRNLRNIARNALVDIEAAPRSPAMAAEAVAIPPGYALVPIEPTSEMVERICGTSTASKWPDDFSEQSIRLRRELARKAWKNALSAVNLIASLPVGWKSVLVNKHFADLIEALEYADDKGYLPDAMRASWESFEYDENIAAPQPAQADAREGLTDGTGWATLEAVEWCIAHGNCGPRTRATLVAVRALLQGANHE